MHVDVCPDNSVAVDAIDLFMESVVNGCTTRDERLRASAAYEGERDEYGSPPPDHLLPIVLQRSQWEWVVTRLVDVLLQRRCHLPSSRPDHQAAPACLRLRVNIPP